jgi:hypothetical protein
MLLSRFIGFLIIAFGFLAQASIRFGEHITAYVRNQKALRQSPPASYTAAPTQTAPSMQAIVPHITAIASPPITQEVPIVRPLATLTAFQPMRAQTPEPEPEQFEPDDLDWAGSLSHAAVASQHLANVLAMVRAGWLAIEHDRLQDASPALDAMEAFQSRTAIALAPILEQMTEAQYAEFFADFDADFPPELQGVEIDAPT